MEKTLQFIIDGSAVKRFHTVTTITQDTVGHHSHNVAMLCLLMDITASKALMMAALFHDLSEHITGDIPSPAKREYGILSQVSDLEESLMREAGVVFPSLSDKDKRTLKLADIASGAIFCATEVNLGNTKLKKIFDTYMSYARQMVLKGRERLLFDVIEEMINDK
jgi:5'-deoxynucleotidase YfbR-like HD superfamily hydrolase